MKYTHVKCPEIPTIKQINIDGKRHYEKGAKRYYSVTKVVGFKDRAGIEAWRARVGDEEADRISEGSLKVGNKLHLLIEDLLQNTISISTHGEQYEYSPFELLENMGDSLKKINHVVAQEQRLYSDKLGLAGTVDCVAEFDGVKSIIDFKNSRKKKYKSYIKKYFLQTTAYSLMWEELTGERINQIVILIADWTGKTTEYIADRDDYIEELCEVLYLYEKDQPPI